MLYILLIQIFISLLCFFTGSLFYKSFDKTNQQSITFCLFTGLVLLAISSQLISLFTPVNQNTTIILCAIVAIVATINYNFIKIELKKRFDNIKSIPLASAALISCLWIMILFFASGPTTMDDTESYHIQSIKWLQEYGSVLGLANLHERYGFHTSWFNAVALFVPKGTELNFYTVVNATISLWLCDYLIIKTSNLSKYKTLKQLIPLIILLLSIIVWPMIRGNATNSNYDFITSALIIILFTECLFNEKPTFFYYQEWIIWIVFLVTVRLINAPLLLLTCYSIIHLIRNKNWKKLVSLILLSLLFIIPFFARQVILSGYPLFPAPYLNFFNVDWKVERSTIDSLLHFIKYFNRVNDMFQPIQVTERLTFPTWISSWYYHLFKYDKFIFIPAITGFAITLVSVKFIKQSTMSMKIFLLTILIQLLTWFFIAPDPRFVYGPFACGTILLFYIISQKVKIEISKYFRLLLYLLISITVLSYTGFKLSTSDRVTDNLIYPTKIPKPKVKKELIGNIYVYFPERINSNWNARCYATDLPCLYNLKPGLELRGNQIKEGFRINQ